MALFSSSKASKPAAPHGQTEYSVALILAGLLINWQPNPKTSDTSKSTISKKGDISLPRTRRPITPDVCPPGRPMTRPGLSAGTAERVGWWVVVVVKGGLIWGQSIDLPSLYLLPAHHAKINGKANSSPPQCGLVNTQLISQSLKLTSQLLTYWYVRHVLITHRHTRTHV